MEKITSFKIDHNIHCPGFYLANITNNIYTYDLRFKWPNKGDYLTTAAAHTIEHLFATVVRNSEKKDSVVYFGPMGCMTGFYLLLSGITPDEALELTKKSLEQCLQIEEVPGASKKECGNYLSHDLKSAKQQIAEYLKTLSTATPKNYKF